ncbi:antiholin-like murein hydrolase modulator LrgA [Staphylococcus sp. NRL 16/872]|uniref:antiholin-like murein hydrolase modulator LrgA n=1 Tax=Staphylococcus sp. NRL 16/872 TaxID=2930131 RepID=UPI001FB312C2|nr:MULTISPECIES: antiholin-like murein hydrolase modulator LrgA [unclassified Staphylococcus]MCJ1655630.1 antiholin-like murein hydrolase modulator LrgA [Staphylococcus sp. NRL 21/187]MCJ1661453.1 antiholin-like murein hydrolase modulator LrgA [Staphylococcus sp. NRL 18/288]MCJ1667356.1 antiholin-like murein hydrolase modulator LrgA [Staphylococcus sp. NRL 19/737]WEN69836.1 antiholin-like murein hydrolase modulator LrgA [Staphylococcus sp. NRL 16/872]
MAQQSSQTTNANESNKVSKTYNFFQQALTISVVLLISKIIESFIPFPMPASVIGLVLLFILLCTGIVKLGQVEKVGTALTNNISFLFVPAGISVINSLPLLSQHPILILLLIIISTLLLLVCVGFVSQLFVTKTLFPTKEQNEKTKLGEGN